MQAIRGHSFQDDSSIGRSVLAMGRVADWIALTAIAGAMTLYTMALRPVDYFGSYHDDTLYFSSAKALAEGRGYIIPSFPGEPRQSKYPILYPWLLSWVWRWNPNFPANLGAAVAVSTVAASAYLVAGWRLLRGLGGLQRLPALTLIGLCAFHPVFLFLAGAVLSDMLFSALTLGAIVAAGPAFGAQRRPVWAAAGILAGLAAATRTLGMAVVAGLALAALHRRCWRGAVVVVVCSLPFLALNVALSQPEAIPSGPPGWRQTWVYYTSYVEFWKLCVPDHQVLKAMVLGNVGLWLEGISSLCLLPTFGQGVYPGRLLAFLLSVGVLSGVVRQARHRGVQPLHFVFVLYSAVTWFWNYPLMDRFLLPFLPLLYTGLVVEVSYLVAMLRKAASRTRAERILAGALALALLVVGGLAAHYYLSGWRRQLHGIVGQRAALQREMVEAYTWIRRNTNPTDRFLAYEDVSLYLYTGRQAVRPISFSTEALYRRDEKLLARDLNRIPEVAGSSGARYWLCAPNYDFALENSRALIQRYVRQLQARFPVVFESSGGQVRVLLLDAARSRRPS